MKKIHYLEMTAQRGKSRTAILNQSDPENVALAAATLLVKNFAVELEVRGTKYLFNDIAWYPDIRKLSLRMCDHKGDVWWTALEEHTDGKLISQAILDKLDEFNVSVWKAREEDASERGFQNTWAKV
ncbi:hypothetical protein [Erwinia phage vB_Ea277G]|jgi:hypothetical protein|nr:hypothetical protein [Erwinia phage vB_Ea277G]